MALNIVESIDNLVPVRRVLISVSDKSGLPGLVKGMLSVCPDMQILSTGGTHAAIAEILAEEGAGGNLVAVSDYTGQPEMQGGLVKTLDFRIYLGLLSETYNPAHQEDLKRLGATPLDMVVVNLYPFRQTVADPGVTPEMARTNIDIGGPCMIRAAAKNYLRVSAVTDPEDYPEVVDELRSNRGATCLATRFRLMQKAFRHTAEYDKAIAGYFDHVAYETAQGVYSVKSL